MTNWICRFVVPLADLAQTIIASTSEEAAMTFHDENSDTGLLYRHEDADGKIEQIRFALVMTTGPDGQETPLVTRMYHSGIWRKGGVKRRGTPKDLAEIAAALGYTHDPQTLVAEGWAHEESTSAAQDRQIRRWSTK